MATTITLNGTTIAPDLVLGYQTSLNVPTIVHRIIGRPDPDITLVDAALRSGSLETFWLTESAMSAALSLLRTPGRFVLASDDVAFAEMSFVVGPGLLSTRLDLPTSRWVLSVPYTEVAAA